MIVFSTASTLKVFSCRCLCFPDKCIVGNGWKWTKPTGWNFVAGATINGSWKLRGVARGSTVEMFIVGAIAAVDSVVPLNGSETQTFVNVNMKQVQFWRLHNWNKISGLDVQSLQASVYYTYLTAWSYKVLHVLWNRSRSIYFDNNIDDKKNEGGQNYEQKHAKLHLPIPLITAHHQLEQITI